MQYAIPHKMSGLRPDFKSVRGNGDGSPFAVRSSSIRGSYLLQVILPGRPLHISSSRRPVNSIWTVFGEYSEAHKFGLFLIGIGKTTNIRNMNSHHEARILSLGMGFRGFWQISARFWGFERAKERSVEVSGVSGDGRVWRGREAVVRGGYEEEIVGRLEGGVVADRRMVQGGYWGGNRGVGRAEIAGTGRPVERLGEECRDGVFGVVSGTVEKCGGAVERSGGEELLGWCSSVGGGVVTVGGEELPGRLWSRLGGDVVTVSASKLVGGSGQHQPRGRRPEVRLYDSLESCLKQRSFLVNGWSCGVGAEGLVRDHRLPAHEIGNHVSQKSLEELSSRKRKSRSVESREPGGRGHGRSRSSQRIERWIREWNERWRFGSR